MFWLIQRDGRRSYRSYRRRAAGVTRKIWGDPVLEIMRTTTTTTTTTTESIPQTLKQLDIIVAIPLNARPIVVPVMVNQRVRVIAGGRDIATVRLPALHTAQTVLLQMIRMSRKVWLCVYA